MGAGLRPPGLTEHPAAGAVAEALRPPAPRAAGRAPVRPHAEIELKFLVPKDRRADLMAEMTRHTSSLERSTLLASYLDTPDRRIARAGMSWRLRREGRRWVQTLKLARVNALERFEHEVIRPTNAADAAAHAGTLPGDRLVALLERAERDGMPVAVRHGTNVRRTLRRLRSSGAVVEVAFDEGWITAGDLAQELCELEFELVSGPVSSVVALARRWQRRFGLVLDPRSKSERGDGLAEGLPHPPLRKAAAPAYARDRSGREAFGAVFDECFAQVSRNAIGLVEGDPELRSEHVHQLRVGIRRWRSALSSFRPWLPAPPPPALIDGLRHLFGTLGLTRDADVLSSGVERELLAAGAPPLDAVPVAAAPAPSEVIASEAVQQLLLDWIDWRSGLPAAACAETAGVELAAVVTVPDDAPPGEAAARDGDRKPVGFEVSATSAPATTAPADVPFPSGAARRLRRWHRRISAAIADQAGLDEVGMHDLRKAIKRQRYALEFFAPVLRAGQVERYLGRLNEAQACMGQLNDLVVARAGYQARVGEEPAAWFALGWLSARLAEAREAARTPLRKLAALSPPEPRHA